MGTAVNDCRVCFIATILVLAASTVAHAQILREERKITPDQLMPSDRFGSSIAMNSNMLAVGAPRFSNSPQPSSAYLIDRFTGAVLYQLMPDDEIVGAEFGSAVALDEQFAVVGALRDDTNGDDAGSVYVFDIRTGKQVHKIIAHDGRPGDFFGVAVAIEAGIMAVGASWDDDRGDRSGTVYLFEASSGKLISKLHAEDAHEESLFGSALAMQDGLLVVGAPLDSHTASNAGSAYLFDVASRTQLHKLLASDGAVQDRFGTAVAISSQTIAIGAWLDVHQGTNSGSAYLFDAQTGHQTAKLLPSDGANQDGFGRHLSIADNWLIVGASGHDDQGPGSGAAYLFDVRYPVQVAKLLTSDPIENHLLGSAVTIYDTSIAVGATGDNSLGNRAGAVYQFVLPDMPLLHATAPCPDPGVIEISWTNATPESDVILLCARDTGSWNIPAGQPCAGTTMGLGTVELQLVYTGQSRDNGARALSGRIDPAACNTFLQLLDRATCTPSNVAPIQ